MPISGMDLSKEELRLMAESLQKERTDLAKAIGQANENGEDIRPIIDTVNELSEELHRVEAAFKAIE